MTASRRDFLRSAGGVAALASAIGAPFTLGGAAQAASHGAAHGKLGKHTLPPLPYGYDALEPYIDEQTMRLHHDMHHQGYVNGLNKAEEMLAKARESGDYDYVQFWSKKASFNGGGHFLHSMFWKTMAPAGNGGGGEPGGDLLGHIERDFGGVEQLKAHFSAAAKSVEGSGWGLLLYRFFDGKLIVLQGENQQKLSPWDSMPVLCLDVWEHAYYLKYNNRRGDYVNAWWNVVNWPMVAENVRLCKAFHASLVNAHKEAMADGENNE